MEWITFPILSIKKNKRTKEAAKRFGHTKHWETKRQTVTQKCSDFNYLLKSTLIKWNKGKPQAPKGDYKKSANWQLRPMS